MNMENTENQPGLDHGDADVMVGARRATNEMAAVIGRDAQRAHDAAQTLISDHPWRAAAIRVAGHLECKEEGVSWPSPQCASVAGTPFDTAVHRDSNRLAGRR